METAEGTVTIKMKGLNKGEPVTFKYPPPLKMSITFDGNGVAEVPLAVAKRLLGPDFEGIYERFERAEKVIVADQPVSAAGKGSRQSKTGSAGVKDFLTKMEEPLVGEGSPKP